MERKFKEVWEENNRVENNREKNQWSRRHIWKTSHMTQVLSRLRRKETQGSASGTEGEHHQCYCRHSRDTRVHLGSVCNFHQTRGLFKGLSKLQKWSSEETENPNILLPMTKLNSKFNILMSRQNSTKQYNPGSDGFMADSTKHVRKK